MNTIFQPKLEEPVLFYWKLPNFGRGREQELRNGAVSQFHSEEEREPGKAATGVGATRVSGDR